MPKELPKVFMDALETHIEKIRENLDVMGKRHKIHYKVGSRYVKIIDDYPGKAVVHFIEINTGGIYKAASWNAPAKGVRGNIFNEKTAGGYYYYR